MSTSSLSLAATRPWVVRFKPSPTARLRLFCFPYAGGGAAAYRPWVAGLPSSIELCAVKLPGREDRLREAPFERLSDLLPVLTQVVSSYIDMPYAFFGHSMGALIGFELARELRRQNQLEPAHLFVSAFRAPQRPPSWPETHRLPDTAFIEEVGRRWGGIPDAVRNEPDLLALLLPTLRADLALVETYAYTSDHPLHYPISAFGGIDDQHVGQDALSAWYEQTSSTFTLTMFPGNHFFVQSARESLLQTLTKELALLVV